MNSPKINEVNRVAFSLLLSFLSERYQESWVLENGCNGAQSELAPLMLREGIQVAGLDIDLNWVREKHNKFRSYSNLKVVCGDSHRLPFKEETFKTVLFIEVIEHLEEPALALQEIYRCLKPEGNLILSTPNALGIWSIATDKILPFLQSIERKIIRNNHFKADSPKHLNVFTLPLLLNQLIASKFKIEKVISVEGLGIANLLYGAYRKYIPHIFGEKKNIKMSFRIYSFLLFLDRGIARLFPLRFHTGWIITLEKESSRQEK